MRRRAAVLVLAALGLMGASADPLELRPRSEPWEPGERLAEEAMDAGQRVPLAFGARLGWVELGSTWSDFRGQAVSPGRYGLHYALQPRLKQHVGADAVRDFALLVPEELGPVLTRRSVEEWIAASLRVSGTRHPAVMALVAWSGGPPPETPVELDGRLVVVRAVGGLVLAFVVEGRALIEDSL